MLAEQAIVAFGEFLLTQGRSTKTVIGYQSDLRRFARYYESKYNGPWYVEDTTTQDIEEFLSRQVVHPATRNRRLYGLRTFFRYLEKQGICRDNPTATIEAVRHVKPERMHLREEELERFIQHIDHPLVRVVALTLAYTGIRVSECVQLRIQDVNFSQRTIFIAAGKGNKHRTLPIADKLYPELVAYYEAHRKGADKAERFFATEATGGISPTHINRVFRQTSELLGYNRPITAHIFRHSFATNLIRRGVSLVHVQKLLGHSSLAVTSIYTHATMDDLTQAVNQLQL